MVLTISRAYLFLILLVGFTTINANAQTNADSIAIKNTALSYIEGWYERDAQRMKDALHPNLVKRIMKISPEGKYRIDNINSEYLITNSGKGEGFRVLPENQQKDISILDIYGTMCVVKLTANDWVDYLQMVKWKGDWKILNVLWEQK